MEFNPRGLYLEREGAGTASRFLNFPSGNCLVGRHETCDIVIKGSSRIVSRKQCKMYFESGRLFIENVSESNHTFINQDRVLQKTEVEVNDLIGLGTCPYNRTSNGIITEDERFVYKCCAPIHINLMSDDEDDDATEVISNDESLQDKHISSSIETPKAQKVHTRDISIQFPSLLNIPRINSPDFSSDASSFIDTGARDAINRIIAAPEENSHSDNESSVSHISLKGARIVLKKLSEADIKKYCSGDVKRPSKTAASSGSSSDSKKVTDGEKPKKDKIDLSPPPKDLSFSRARYDSELKAKLIKRRISQFVDPESDNDEKEPKMKQPATTNGVVVNKLIERAKKSSRSSSESSKSHNSQKSSRHRHSSSSSRDKKNRSTDDHQQPSSKKRKIGEHESSKSTKERNHKDRKPKTSDAENKLIPVDKTSEKSEIKTKDKEEPKNVANSVAPVEKFAFPTLNNDEKLATVSKKITVRRHTTYTPNPMNMELFEPSDSIVRHPPRRQSIAIQELPRKDPETKRLHRMAKRLKSVGEKPAATTVSEEIKKKLKDLAQKKQANLPEKEAVDISKETVTKATTSKAPMKVKVTSNNRGNYLTEDLPKARSTNNSNNNNNNNVVKKAEEKPSPTKKSAVNSFYDKFVRPPTSKTTATTEIDDPPINIEISAPTHDPFNQPISTGFYNQISPSGPNVIKTTNPQPRKLSFSAAPPPPEFQLEEFPKVPFAPSEAAPHIIETELKSKINLISIMAPVLRKVKKTLRVCFKDDKDLVSIRSFPSSLPETLSQTTIQRKLLKDLETSVCDELLSWDIQWLKQLELPETWKNVSMKNSYESIDDYKGILKSLMRIELLSKLKSSNKTSHSNNSTEKEFTAYPVKQSRKQNINHHYQLELITNSNPKYFYRGMLIIMKIRDASRTDIDFFGYVSDVRNSDGNSAAFIEIIYKELPMNLSVVKCKSLMYIRNDIKSFVAIENIQEDVPIIHHIINPQNNKLISNWSTDLQINTELDEEQKKIVNVITSDCLNNRKDANVIALQSKAGTGKTRILIESIISIINCSKRDGVKFSILVCAMSNFCVDEIATQTNSHPSKNQSAKLARVGAIDKLSNEARKLRLHDLKALKDYDVVFTTVNSAYDIYNYKKDFDVCFIDDANCCMDSELVILMQLNITKLFLIGDIFQTQPMSQSQDLLDSKYDETFFARMINTFKDKEEEGKPILELTTQHRMADELTSVLDGFIYSDYSLSSKVDNRLASSSHQLVDLSVKPFLIMSIKEEKMTMNLKNLSMLYKGICSKLPKLQKEKDVDVTIGIIMRTTCQRDFIKKELYSRNNFFGGIEVFSIDHIQGLQKDIIILGIVERPDVIYLSCLNRLNSAMTRARSAFYIAGCSSIFQTPIENCSQWNKIIEYAGTNDQIKQITSAGDYEEIYKAITKLDDKENQEWW